MTRISRQGTVFVHAVANIQSTFATEAIIRVQYPEILDLEETTGPAPQKKGPDLVKKSVADGDKGDTVDLEELVINIGNIQYGQSRDIFLRRRELLPTIPSGTMIKALMIHSVEGCDIRLPRPPSKASILSTSCSRLRAGWNLSPAYK